MSLSSWKSEFYPTLASKCSKRDALQHSLRKWKGLRIKNLSKHDVRLDRIYLVCSTSYRHITIDSSTCALCTHYWNPDDVGDTCTSCPLFAILEEDCSSVYTQLVDNSNPEPMISLLDRAAKRERDARRRKRLKDATKEDDQCRLKR